MVVKFNVRDWREIIKTCGAVTATCPSEREVCRYIDLLFMGNECVAYGSNCSQVTKTCVPCVNVDIPWMYHLLVLPEKIPPRTHCVELFVDPKAKEYMIVYSDTEDDEIDGHTVPFFEGDPPDYDAMFKDAHKHLDSFDFGYGKYHIMVNPNILMNALEGMKSFDRVVLKFGDMAHPFTISPEWDSSAIEALVYPGIQNG